MRYRDVIYIIFRSEGNLIISLDNANPTQLLLSALQKEGMQVDRIKEDDFYLGEVAEDLQVLTT